MIHCIGVMLPHLGEELKKNNPQGICKDALSILDRQDYLLQLLDQIPDLRAGLMHQQRCLREVSIYSGYVINEYFV